MSAECKEPSMGKGIRKQFVWLLAVISSPLSGPAHLVRDR
jgi:hypothetical protein